MGKLNLKYGADMPISATVMGGSGVKTPPDNGALAPSPQNSWSPQLGGCLVLLTSAGLWLHLPVFTRSRPSGKHLFGRQCQMRKEGKTTPQAVLWGFRHEAQRPATRVSFKFTSELPPIVPLFRSGVSIQKHGKCDCFWETRADSLLRSCI